MQGSRFRVQGLILNVWISGFWVRDFGFGVWGLGFGVLCLGGWGAPD